MTPRRTFDRADANLLLALADSPRATTAGLAERTGISRNTVHARLNRWDEGGAIRGFDRRIDPAYLGYPLRAFVFTRVQQVHLDAVAEHLRSIVEVISVDGISGEDDLLVQVVARDADDMYRVAGRILDIDGVDRTRTSLVMRELVEYRVTQLIEPDRAGPTRTDNPTSNRTGAPDGGA